MSAVAVGASVATYLVPTGICFSVDTVSVQNPPASPEYWSQFFSAWKVPARGESWRSSFASRPAAITLRFFVWLIGAVASFALHPPATSNATTGKANRYVILSLHEDSAAGHAFVLDQADTAL